MGADELDTTVQLSNNVKDRRKRVCPEKRYV